MGSRTVSVRRDVLQGMLRDGFVRRGLSLVDADFITADLLAAEAQGKRTHGVIKFPDVCAAITRRTGTPVMVRSDGPLVMFDGRRELGHLVARRMVQVALSLVPQHGVAIVAANNFSYYGRIAEYVKAVAGAGFAAIMLNSAGPAAVVPHHGRSPILGTNPIAFGFPRTDRKPLVIDMATSAEVWGEIALAQVNGESLPDGAFINKTGEITTEPAAVVGVLPFGGPKGSALALAVEILGGAMTSMPTGSRVRDEYDLGAILIALDPDRLGGVDFLAQEVARLTLDIERSGDGLQSVRVPGDREYAQGSDSSESLQVSCAVLDRIREAMNG